MVGKNSVLDFFQRSDPCFYTPSVDAGPIGKKNLWVCRFGTGSISIFNRFAKKIGSLKLPAKNITNCTFGGKNNSNLFIITARKKMKKNDYKKYIFSGALIKVKTNTKGTIQKKFYYNL